MPHTKMSITLDLDLSDPRALCATALHETVKSMVESCQMIADADVDASYGTDIMEAAYYKEAFLGAETAAIEAAAKAYVDTFLKLINEDEGLRNILKTD